MALSGGVEKQESGDVFAATLFPIIVLGFMARGECLIALYRNANAKDS